LEEDVLEEKYGKKDHARGVGGWKTETRNSGR
jgi:hypothetical protein